MSKDINVVAALIFKDNKVLIAKRSTDKDAKGKWEFPGGKVEENEDEKIWGKLLKQCEKQKKEKFMKNLM